MRKHRTVTRGLVGGSFDPLTDGHTHLIVEAARLFDEVDIVIGVNPSKKYLFSAEEREALVREVVATLAIKETPIHFHFLKDRLLIQLATDLGATHLLRGIRNATDYEYERQMALVNRKINPAIRTVYVAPPPELTEVSSSTVKGLVGFEGWEGIVRRYVHPKVLDALMRKHLEKQSTAGV
jgi:pantetheine-phosphate adenylyltransferase